MENTLREKMLEIKRAELENQATRAEEQQSQTQKQQQQNENMQTLLLQQQQEKSQAMMALIESLIKKTS